MMGVTVAHIVAASAVATWALLPVLGGMAAVVVTVLLTPLMLVFGEVIPKAVAREWATALILSLFRPLELASAALAPRSRGRPTRWWAGPCGSFGGRQADAPALRLARGAQAPAPDGAGGGGRDGSPRRR